MLVFDPLAIALVLASNFAFSKIKEEDNSQEETKSQEEEIQEESHELKIEEIKEKNHIDIKFNNDISDPLLDIKEIAKNEEENIQVEAQDLDQSNDKYSNGEFGGYKAKAMPPVDYMPPQNSVNPLSLR